MLRTATTYAYDADGRLTARPTAGGQTLLWDDLGRLTQVKNAAGTVTLATYTYDPLDRLRLVDRGTTDQVRFRYVGTTTAVAQVLDHDAGTVSRNIATGWDGTRLADWTGAGADLRVYGTNAHHDVTFTTGAAGTVTATARYDPWGTLAASSGTLPDFGFQGSWTDAATQLLWVVTRWYAPAEGRFISEDSLLGEPERPASRHLYAYGEGEPVGRWDPDGRDWYRVPTDRSLGSLASHVLVSSNRWPMLVNANRNRLPASSTAARIVRAGTCLDVPVDWLASATTQGTAELRVAKSRCQGSGSSFRYLSSGDIRTVLQAQRGAGIGDSGGVFSFTRGQLIAATQRTVGDRARSPGWDDLDKYRRRLGCIHDSAIEFSRGHRIVGPSSYRDARGDMIILTDVKVVQGTSPFFCEGRPCTIGQYVFIPGGYYRGLLEHEYVHVLQWEGRGSAFARTYLDDLIEGRGYSPQLPLEAPAYLWEYWAKYLSRWEPLPWEIWKAPWGVG